MIISNSQIRNLLTNYLKQGEKASESQSGVEQKDLKEQVVKADIIQNPKVYSAAKDVIKELPDIRQDRTDKIEKQVKTGTYEVTDEEVAEKMIGRSLVDKMV